MRQYEDLDDLQQKAIDDLYEHDERLALLETGFGSLETGELASDLRGFFAVPSVRRVFGVERPKVHGSVHYSNGRRPAPGLLLEMRPFLMAGRSIRRAVRFVLIRRRFSEVSPRIVEFIHVNVVYLFTRPFAGHIEPRQPVGLVNPFPPVIGYADVPISGIGAQRASYLPLPSAPAATTCPSPSPRKHPRKRVVMQQLVQKFGGEFVLEWQRQRGLLSTDGIHLAG